MNIFFFDTPDGNRQYSFRTVLSEVTSLVGNLVRSFPIFLILEKNTVMSHAQYNEE